MTPHVTPCDPTRKLQGTDAALDMLAGLASSEAWVGSGAEAGLGAVHMMAMLGFKGEYPKTLVFSPLSNCYPFGTRILSPPCSCTHSHIIFTPYSWYSRNKSLP